VKIPFAKLEDEISAVTSALETERILEREYYLSSGVQAGQKIKGCRLEEEFYVTGETWRLTLSSNQDLSGKAYLKNGSPVHLESGDFSLVCQVYKSYEKTIILQYKGDLEIPDTEPFSISPWYSESTYNIFSEAIEAIANKEEKRARNLLAWILGYNANDKPSVPKNYQTLSKIERICQVDDFLFIFGPPGTGKTTLLVSAIQRLRESNKTILALTPTNFACDYLVEKAIEKKLKPVRLGLSAKISEEIQPFQIDSLIEASKEQKQISEWKKEHKQLIKKAKAWKRTFGSTERDERKILFAEAKTLIKSIDKLADTVRSQLIDSADVVISTFAPAWNFYRNKRKFDYVIIDEATQGLEPAFYLALLLADKVIIAGDPKQLPPTLNAEESILSETFLVKGISRDDGNRTLFLNEQYRMPEEILKFSNVEFYDNKITTVKKNTVSLFDENLGGGSFEKNLIWIDTAGSDAEENYETNDDSCFNQMEIDLIISLFSDETDFSKIAILSPYRKQVQNLLLAFQDRFPGISELPIVQTIDSFQGREADTIILSLVRTNDLGEMGFLKDYRRLNVGLTRARERLIIIGNSITLSEDRVYSRLLNLVKDTGEYRSIFEFLY
jgi:ATP-dependent RNA/DNA helicase IGHMBP2